MLLAKIQRQRGKKNSFCQILTQQRLCMCRFTNYWFQDVLNTICVKVAAKLRQKEYFSLYFNVNFMTSQRRQFLSDFVEITFIQQRMSLRSYLYQIHALLQLICKALKKKNDHPPKLSKISFFFPVFASPQHKNVYSQKKKLC